MKNPDKNDNIAVAVLAAFYIFIGIMMFLSKPEPPVVESIEYNGYLFVKNETVWVTTMRVSDKFQGWSREYEVYFHYIPQEVINISTMMNSRNETIAPNLFIDAKKIYITTDPEYPSEVILGGVEIAKILGKIYQKDVSAALTRPDPRGNYPVITCEDIATGQRVIHLKLGNSTRIYSDQGCVIVEGDTPQNVVRASERLAYEMLRIL